MAQRRYFVKCFSCGRLFGPMAPTVVGAWTCDCEASRPVGGADTFVLILPSKER